MTKQYATLDWVKAILALLAFCGVMLLYFFFPNTVFDVKYFNINDPSVYLLEARNLIELHRFGLFNGDLFTSTRFHPPGFATLLTPVVYFFKSDFVAIKYYLIIFSLVTIGISYKLFRIYLQRDRAILCVLILALSPFTFILSRVVLAEIPLMCCFILALIGFDLLFFKNRPIAGGFLCVGATAGAYLIKGLGLALLFSPVLTVLILNHRRYWQYYFSYLFVAIIPFLILFYRNHTSEVLGYWGQSTFTDYIAMFDNGVSWEPIQALLIQMMNQIKWYDLYHLLQLILPAFFHPLSEYSAPSEIIKFSAVAFLMAIIILFVINIRKRKNLFLEGLFIGSILILLPHQLGGAVRFWYPAGFLFAVIYTGYLDKAFSTIVTRFFRIKMDIPIILILVLVFMIPALAREVDGLKKPYRDKYYGSYIDAAEWAKKNLDAENRYSLVGLNDALTWQALTLSKTAYPLGASEPRELLMPLPEGDSGRQYKITIVRLNENYLSDGNVIARYKADTALLSQIIDSVGEGEYIYRNEHWSIYEAPLTDKLLSVINNYYSTEPF